MTTTGPFLLFAGLTYYPDEGAIDITGKFDTLDEAVAEGMTLTEDWAHVLNVATMEVTNIRDSEYCETPFEDSDLITVLNPSLTTTGD